MDFLTYCLHLCGSGAAAYFTAAQLRDPLTRPNLLAGFQLAESGAVPFLSVLKERALTDGDEWLAAQLERHADDERRHGEIFAHALRQLGKEVLDVTSLRQEASSKDSQNSSPFFEAYYAGYPQAEIQPENIDWLVYFGSFYILELDASQDFMRMARVLPSDRRAERSLQAGLTSIAQDETRHASYLREAIYRRLGPVSGDKFIASWRKRKVDALIAVLGRFIGNRRDRPNLVKDAASLETQPSELVLAA